MVRLLYYNRTFEALRYWNLPIYLRCRLGGSICYFMRNIMRSIISY